MSCRVNTSLPFLRSLIAIAQRKYAGCFLQHGQFGAPGKYSSQPVIGEVVVVFGCPYGGRPYKKNWLETMEILASI
jgi:hypothetical protein